MKTKRSDPAQMKLEMRRPNDDDRPPLPEGWVWTTIGEICEVNPRIMRPEEFTDESSVSFVPMAAVDDVSGMIVEPQIRPVGEVWKGYTRFAENDVIFAKITPCMENGKAAIARNLANGLGLGSTEFHVLRSSGAVLPEWVFHFVRQNSFRGDAAARMTGTAGQLRVPAAFMKESFIPLAPLPEQHRIVEAIETQFTRLDAAVAALHRAKANLARYKASVLKAACEGRLVPTDAELYRERRRGEATPQASIYAQMREDTERPGPAEPGWGCLAPSTASHIGGKGEATPQPSTYAQMREDTETPDPEEPGWGCLAPTDTDTGDIAYEPADVLLRRILAERRVRWMADNPSKRYVEPSGPDMSGLPELPEGWCWVTVEQICETIGGVTKGRNFKSKTTRYLPYLRVANVQRGYLNLSEVKEIEVAEDEIDKYLLCEGDLVLTEGGDWDKLGRSAVWENQVHNCIHQNHIFRARLYVSDIPTEWLMYYTNSEQGKNYFKEASKQTTNLASINLGQLRSCPIPLPPLAEQHRIVAEVERRLSVVAEVEAAVEANLARAARLRQAILREAFAGRLVPRGDGDTDGVGVV